MARRKKDAGQDANIIALNVPAGSDLSIRLETISKQTGLSIFELIYKWTLQETAMLGALSYGKNGKNEKKQAAQKTEEKPARQPRKKISPVEVEIVEPVETEGSNYRDTIVKRVRKLKSEGWTLKKIADTFNDEKVSTVSGTGKWYTSSITWLLNSTK